MSDRKIIYLDDAIDALKKEQAYYSSEDGAEIFYEYNHAIKALKNLPSAQQWIPCSERPPEADGEYLVTVEGYLEGEHVLVLNYGTPLLPMNVGEGRAWYLSDIEGDFYYDGVTAWMPLPEPWRGESNDRT